MMPLKWLQSRHTSNGMSPDEHILAIWRNLNIPLIRLEVALKAHLAVSEPQNGPLIAYHTASCWRDIVTITEVASLAVKNSF